MSELKTNLQSILQEKTTKLIPENIKRKVEIFDVTGTDGDAEVEELQAKIIETRQEIADTRRDLENSAATVTGTGENITLNQTAEATFKKLGVGGNSKQIQYTGKNLYSAGNQTFELNKYVSIEPIPAGTYKLIGNFQTTDTDSTICLLSFAKDNVEVGFKNVSRGNISTTVTLSDEANIIRMYASNNYVNSEGDTATFTNIMITNTDVTDTVYEPYVGGTASPNPDYPQEIENCGDNVNEWDKELEVAAWTDEGVKNPNNHLFVVNSTPKDVKPNTAYTVSQKESPSQYRISFFNNNTFISNIYNAQDTTEGYKSYTFTTPSNCNKVYVHFRSTLEVIAKGTYDMTTEDITNIKLELGTIATSYSPYGCGNVNMKVSNKNLFNKDTILLNRELVGKYGNVISTSGWYVSDFIRVKPNTNYRLTKGANGSSNCFYDINKKFIETVMGTRDIASPNDDRVAYVRFNGVLTDLDISSIQFEEGSTITDYVAHQEQTFTFPLAEGQKLMLGDYLADDGIHRVRGQVTFDGSEDEIWSQFSYTANENNFRVQNDIALPNILTPPTNPANLLCNYFKAVNRDSAYVKAVVGIAQYGLNLGTIFISAPISILQNQTLQGWKDWLAEHNLIVEYLLNEEVIVPYTSAQQEVYDAMKRAISYEEQTNVSSLDAVSPIFTVTAFRDADLVITLLDNQLTLKE